jgi:plasmid maintenance system antidote protein VapI
MKMAELVKMIQERQGQMSIEEYANKMGIRGATLYRYYNQERKISIEVVQKLAQFYKNQNDTAMLNALSSYALDGDSSS